MKSFLVRETRVFSVYADDEVDALVAVREYPDSELDGRVEIVDIERELLEEDE